MPRSVTSSRPRDIGERLPKASLRLLSSLAEHGAVASPDPLREGQVSVRGSSGGVSLGRGSHPRATLDDLARRDLVEPTGDRGAFAISVVGRARLARESNGGGGQQCEAFAGQHREIGMDSRPGPGGPEEVAVNLRESPLAWLRRRRGPDGDPLIDAAAFQAGERLRSDITLAGMLPSVTARWDGAIGGGGQKVRDPAAASDMVIAARQRVRAAITAVGAEFGDLLLDLCGFLKGVETIERERRWPQRSGKIVIRLALGQLARHYGLSNEATGRDCSRRVRTWFAQDAA